MRLQDKVAIITGGGSGIGLAYSRRFLMEGAKVMVADIGEEQGRHAVAELSPIGDIDFVRTDISDEASVDACVAATIERFGGVHILLNNAAIYGDYEPQNQSLEYLRRMFDVNVHGQWLMSRAVSPHLVRQGWGRIINVASIAAFLHQLSAQPGVPAEDFSLSSFSYQHSKWSVMGLTRHMAGQLGQYNVTVNAIAPGLVMTPATDKQVPTDFQPMFAMMSSMRRNTEADHMVGPAVFFASSDADLVNGQTLVVDGGNVMLP